MTTTVLNVGTRISQLARWQTDHIIARLQDAWPDLTCEVVPFVTKGDKTLDKPLPQIGGKGLFTAELERALHTGEIDIAVHSLKDLPVANPPGLTLGAIASRAPVQDGLVACNGWTLQTLPKGAIVGTSSNRRRAQLLAVRPDFTVRSIRGNVETRVRKVMEGDYHAAVLARAGLERLNLTDVVTEWLPLELMLPAPGQGALAVQCRADDEATLTLLAAVDDMHVRAAVTAERTFLDALGGGCSAPIAAHAQIMGENEVQMRALVAAPDGGKVVYVSGVGSDAAALGRALAQEAAEQGGATILDALHPLRGRRIVVTRARHQAQSLADKLQEVGATSLLVPAIHIAPMPDMSPLADAIRDLDTYDWVIFTSSNGVRVFWEQLNEMGRDASVLEDVQIGVVGSATARALGRRRGVTPDFMPDEFVGEALAAGLGDVSGQKILLPRAEIARKNLAELLTEAGATVTDLPTYRTLPADIDERALAELKQGVDAVTFTSGSTVRNFMNAIGDRIALGDVVVACIGPITAESARKLGLPVDVVPDEYTTDGLVAALAEYFQQ